MCQVDKYICGHIFRGFISYLSKLFTFWIYLITFVEECANWLFMTFIYIFRAVCLLKKSEKIKKLFNYICGVVCQVASGSVGAIKAMRTS